MSRYILGLDYYRYSCRFIVVGRSCVVSYISYFEVHVFFSLYRHAMEFIVCCNAYLVPLYSQTDHAGYKLRVLLVEGRFTDPNIIIPCIILIICIYDQSKITVVVPHLRERWVLDIAYCLPASSVVAFGSLL